jgi:sigma-70-like protein
VSVGEDGLRDLLVRGLTGDTVTYHAFLKRVSAHLRAFLRRRLARLPDRLPDRQRLPIIHMRLEGLSVVEVARMTGMPEAAVMVVVSVTEKRSIRPVHATKNVLRADVRRAAFQAGTHPKTNIIARNPMT